jgi:hypothetical protein
MNGKLWAWAWWVCLVAGCTGVEEPGDDAPPVEAETPAARLLGAWELRDTGREDIQRYVFGGDGRFRSISIRHSDTSIIEGTYNVIDSMTHVIIHKAGTPLEEIWLRFAIRNDSMAMSKGISLRGESKSLVGEWKTTATVPDSAGRYRAYTYTFAADGYLLIPYPDLVDTSRYVVDGRLIRVHDPHTGGAKMTLAHEIIEDRLSLYNPDTEKWLRRIR